MERSILSVKPEIRIDGNNRTISGYAAVFYREGQPDTEYRIGPYYERIKRGAFREAILRDDVRALFNHDPSMVLGRNASGTLRLHEDERGLRYEIDAPDTQMGRDVATSIERGDVSGSSFAFIAARDDIETYTEEDKTIREIQRLELYDVGPVTFPAYSGTEASVRSDAIAQVKDWLERQQIDRQQDQHQHHLDVCRSYAYAKTVDLNL